MVVVLHFETPAIQQSWCRSQEVGVFCLPRATRVPKETTVNHGDHVRVFGKDGLYVFLKEVQGTATLRLGGRKSPEEPTLAIAMDRIVSLEQPNIACPHPSGD